MIESSDTVTQRTFREAMVRCGLSHVLLHQEHVHIISDTPEKDQSEMQKASKMKWMLLHASLMKIC